MSEPHIFKAGTQIAYVPSHANGDIGHPDVEFGFVTSARGDVHLCRYWRKDEPGALRTVANSEATPTDLLIQYVSVGNDVIKQLMWETTR